jgi:hypothetical protein
MNFLRPLVEQRRPKYLRQSPLMLRYWCSVDLTVILRHCSRQ